MSASVEVILGDTIEKWNSVFKTRHSSKQVRVRAVARNVLKLTANLSGIPEKELTDSEEVSWGDNQVQLGFDFTTNPSGEVWIVATRTKKNPEEVAKDIWLGFLLKHRTSPKMLPFEDSINSLIGIKTQST